MSTCRVLPSLSARGREAAPIPRHSWKTSDSNRTRLMRKRSRQPGALCKSPAHGFPFARVGNQETRAELEGRMSASTAAHWPDREPQKAESEKAFPSRSASAGPGCLANTELPKGRILRLTSVLGFHPGALSPGLLRGRGLGVCASADLLRG